jgi:hypothetical protein
MILLRPLVRAQGASLHHPASDLPGRDHSTVARMFLNAVV